MIMAKETSRLPNCWSEASSRTRSCSRPFHNSAPGW